MRDDDAVQKAYEARIDALFAGASAARFSGVTVLEHSDVLDMLGFGDKPVHLAEGYMLTSAHKHPSVSADEWKKIPQWIETPSAVFDSDTVDGRLVFIAPELLRGSPIRIVITPNVADKNSLTAHLVINLYDTHAGKHPFVRWAADGLLRYVDTKKAPQIDEGFGLRLPDILKNPNCHPSAQIHSMGRGKQQLAERTKILTEKNLAGYRKNRLLSEQKQSAQQSVIDLQGLCPREAAKKLFAATGGDLRQWDVIQASAKAAGFVINRKMLEAVQGKPALLMQEAMVKALSANPKSAARSLVKSAENTR